MHTHRPAGLLGIKLLALLVAPLVVLWGPPLLLRTTSPPAAMWVKVAPGPNGTAAASSSSPVSVTAAAENTTPAAGSESILQTCVRDGGFYKGEWLHRPNTSKPHAHYAWGLAGTHQFFNAELAFRRARPLVPTGPGGGAQPQPPSYLPHNQHDWTPHASACRLSPFNRTRACLALREAAGPSRRVLFVGDSMSFQHALSLLLMLGPEGNAGRRVPKQTMWAEAPICADVLGGENNSVLIHFIRNDALYVAPVALDGWASRPDLAGVAHDGVDFGSSRPWTPWFEVHLPGLVVLNMGLHIHGLEYYRALLDDALAYLRGHRAAWARTQRVAAAYPRLLFRTTAPGHPECWRHSAPVSGAEAIANMTRFEGKYRDKFTWHLVAEFNDYLERRLGEVFEREDAAADADSVLLLRAEGITQGRPDGHLVGELKDCLHYNLPGPLDAWTLTFLETLYALHSV